MELLVRLLVSWERLDLCEEVVKQLLSSWLDSGSVGSCLSCLRRCGCTYAAAGQTQGQWNECLDLFIGVLRCLPYFQWDPGAMFLEGPNLVSGFTCCDCCGSMIMYSRFSFVAFQNSPTIRDAYNGTSTVFLGRNLWIVANKDDHINCFPK